jgi:DNA-binding winged helix-turn-helix (wHTH) protein/tetratricopeptide (TPR) repeat protein
VLRSLTIDANVSIQIVKSPSLLERSGTDPPSILDGGASDRAVYLPGMEWAFGDCVLSEELFQLRRAGRVIRLEPKVFHVFRFLVENRERVVTKAEILDAVWPGEAITESVLPRSVAVIRRAVGDDRARQHVIETVHGHGYRFVAPLNDRPPRAVAEEDGPSEARVPATAEGSDFVGRGEVLARLRQALDASVSGQGRIALLVGEPGIGKTRTVERTLLEVAGRAGTYTGACFEGEGAPSYWPFVQILRALLDELEDGALSELVRAGDADWLPLVPEWRDRLPDLPETKPFEGEQARFRLFDGLAGFLRRCAKRRPRVFVLEDLHWADRDSMLLTSFLGNALRDAPVLIVGTYRDLDVGPEHPLGTLLRDLARLPHSDRIPLGGLGPDHVVELLRRTAGEELEDPVSAAIVELTDGNPFFVRELALLVSEGARFDVDEREVLPIELPRGIRDAVGLRLTALSPACYELLGRAAVIGREFNGRVLFEQSADGAEDALELLGEALAAGLLEEHRTAGRYAFSHALVRQALYDELGLLRRIDAHRATAEALERIYGDRSPDHLAELAFHLFQSAVGGDPLRSVEISERAAALSHRQSAYDDAVRHLERALEALDLAEQSDAARRCELILAQAEARWDAGQRDGAHEKFRLAAEIARELDRPELLARAAVGMRSYGDNTRPDGEAVRLLEEALEVVGDRFPVWRARILSRLTYCDPHTREMSNRVRLSEEASALTEHVADAAVLFDVFVGRYWATLGPDALEARVAVGREAAEAGRRLGDARLVLLGHDTLVGAHLVLGDFQEVGRHVASFEKIAGELRQPFFEFHGLILQIVYAMNCGRFREAEALLERAAQRGGGFVQDADALSAGITFWLRDMRGETTDPSEAQEILQAVGSRLLSSTGTDQIVKASIIEVCLAVGQLDVARVQLRELFENDIEELSRNENWLVTMSLASSAAIALDEPEIAERLYRLLLPYEHLMFVHDHLHVSRGSVASSLGALAGVTGRHDEAVERLRAAITREEAIGAQPAALDTRILLIQQFDRMGNAESAAQETREATQVAQGFGSRRIYRVFPHLED